MSSKGRKEALGIASCTWAILSLSISLCKEYTHADADGAPSSSSSSSSSSFPYPRDSVMVSYRPKENAGHHSYWTLQYDQRTRNPKWTHEHLYRKDYLAAREERADRKKSHFFTEHSIQNENFRILSKDYTDSQFDRGHMIPAADFKLTQKSLNSTFSMANISPQYSSMNRGVWESLESFVRSLITSEHYQFEEMEVISGPVFAPFYSNGKWMYIHNTIGTFPKLITVPSHFFKVILCRKFIPLEHNPDVEVMSTSLAAFLVPNIEDGKMKNEKGLSSYLIRLDQLESLVGLTFFDKQITVTEKAKCDSTIPANRDLKILLDLDNPDKDRWVPLLQDASTSGSTGIRIGPKNKNTLRKEEIKDRNVNMIISKFNHLCSVVNCNCNTSKL